MLLLAGAYYALLAECIGKAMCCLQTRDPPVVFGLTVLCDEIADTKSICPAFTLLVWLWPPGCVTSTVRPVHLPAGATQFAMPVNL